MKKLYQRTAQICEQKKLQNDSAINDFVTRELSASVNP